MVYGVWLTFDGLWFMAYRIQGVWVRVPVQRLVFRIWGSEF